MYLLVTDMYSHAIDSAFIHCHPMQFPHPFLLDGTVTNAMEMIGNILEHGADIFMVQEEYILKYKLHGHGPPTQ